MELQWRVATSQIQRVTPIIAASWLKRNTSNRPLKSSVVAQLVRDIQSGFWKTTHQGIAFDYDGNLIDGQHRLEAIVRAGCAVDIWVATGQDPDCRRVIDIGSKRSPVDALVLSGRQVGFGSVGGNTEAGMWSRMMWGLRQTKGKETRAELLAFAEDHRSAGEWTVAEFGQHSRSCAHKAPVMAAVARAFYHVDRGRLAEFVQVVTTGFPVSHNEDDHAAITFRNALLDGRLGGNSNVQADLYGKACRAIDYFMQRRNCSKFYAPSEEPYPLPLGPSTSESNSTGGVVGIGRLTFGDGPGSASMAQAPHS